MATKKKDIFVILILWAFTAMYFLLKASSDFASALNIIIFTVMAGISLIVLLFLKNDDSYYENLTPTILFLVLLAAGVMYAVSLISAMYFPASEAPLLAIPDQTSVLTGVIAACLFTVTMVALSEEALKFGGYTEFKERFKGRWYRWFIAFLPVMLWAGYHAIQAYSNLWYLIPAFVDGMVLLALLEYTHSFIAVFLAHGAYNSIVTINGYMGARSTLPLFPEAATTTDFLLLMLTACWAAAFLAPTIHRQRQKGKLSYYK